MDLATLLKFLHIVSMFGAVTLLVGSSLVLDVVLHRGDVQAMRAVWRIAGPLNLVGVGVVIAGVVFGLLTALTGGFDFFRPWLLIAYAITIALFVLGPIESGIHRRVFALADSSPTDAPSAELAAARSEPLGRRLLIVSVALYVAIIYVMVAKPLS